MIGIRTVMAAAVVAALALPAGAAGHAPDRVFSAFGTPSLDGVVGETEWADASALAFQAGMPGGGTIPGELRIMNDASNLYLAVRLGTTSPTTSVAFGFDNDHDGVWPEEGSDGLALGFGVRNFFGDLVLSGRDGCPGALCGFHDVDLGGTVDGQGLRTIQGGETQIEISHPLDSADDLNDFSVAAGEVLGFGFQVAVCSSSLDCVFTQPVSFTTMGDIIVAEHKTPEEQLADLAVAVEGVGPGGSLAAKVHAAGQALERADVSAVRAILDAFVNEVEAQAGKSIAPATAGSLVAAATHIKEALA
jgi:hypothetical protein